MVKGAAATIEFMQRALGGELVRSIPLPGAKIGRSEARLDDSLVLVSDELEGWPADVAHVHVYVADVDAAYARALAAGATSAQAPTRKSGDDDERGGVRDAGGTKWGIATRVRGAPVAQGDRGRRRIRREPDALSSDAAAGE